jgi:hypothetical protein
MEVRMYRKIGVLLLVLLAMGLFSAQRYRNKPVTYKYPYWWSAGTETNVRKIFPSDIANHSWYRNGGTDTVDVWYFVGGDSTRFRIAPHSLGTLIIDMDHLSLYGGAGGGVRVIKDTATKIILWGVTNRK